MKLPLQITTRKVSLSELALETIEQRAKKLEQFCDNIIGCRVMVEAPHRHKQQGLLYNVRVDITVPNGELVVKREPDENIYIAIRETFEAAQRKLKAYRRKRRGEVKNHNHNGNGTVVEPSPGPEVNNVAMVSKLFADEGFGYLETRDGREIYFSSQDVLDANIGDLEIGTPVRYAEMHAEHGMAAEVSLR